VSVNWSNLTVCGIPVVLDPTADDGELVAHDGDLLVVNLHMEDGVLVGATGHISRKEVGEIESGDS
jgi:hypothetical protein